MYYCANRPRILWKYLWVPARVYVFFLVNIIKVRSWIRMYINLLNSFSQYFFSTSNTLGINVYDASSSSYNKTQNDVPNFLSRETTHLTSVRRSTVGARMLKMRREITFLVSSSSIFRQFSSAYIEEKISKKNANNHNLRIRRISFDHIIPAGYLGSEDSEIR